MKGKDGSRRTQFDFKTRMMDTVHGVPGGVEAVADSKMPPRFDSAECSENRVGGKGPGSESTWPRRSGSEGKLKSIGSEKFYF